MISEQNKKKILEIKHLKENNWQKNYLTWMTYYKEFRRPKSQKNPIKITLYKNSKNNDNFFYFRLRNKNSQIYKDDERNKYLNTFNPYVTMMMSNATNLTQYDHTEYVQGNRLAPSKTISNFSASNTEYTHHPKKKKFFGLDGKTPLYDNEQFDTNTDNFKMSSLNDLYMKTSMGMKTMGYLPTKENKNYNTKYNYNNSFERHFTIEDEEFANNIFFDGNLKKEDRRYNKEERKKFYKKFYIDKRLTFEEENEIEKKIKNNHDIQKKIIESRDYRDPFKSKKILKINSQMADTVEKIRLDLQCQKFQEEYDSICKFNIKKNRMPNIKILSKNLKKEVTTTLKKLKNRKKSITIKEDKYSNLKEYLNHKMQEAFIHESKISKYDHHLNEFKLDLGIIPIRHHPDLRTFSSCCYDEAKSIIYLYGGIGGKKFGDLWEFKYDPMSGRINWNKIYSPSVEDETEYDYMEIEEPLPRFGHTIHYINNKIYVFGGEFDKWDKSKYKNDVLWIYDFNKNEWELDKCKNNNIINNKIKRGSSSPNKNILQSNKSNLKKSKIRNNNNDPTQNINEKSKSYKYIPKIKNNNNTWFKNSKVKFAKNKIFEKEERKVTFSKQLTIKATKSANQKTILKNTKNVETNNNNKDNDEPNLKENLEENKAIFPCLRRNHVSLIVGSTILIYGGISTNENYLNDCWIYDLKNGKWDLLDFSGRYPPPLGFHSCCIALEKEQLHSEFLTVYNKPASNRKTLPLLKLDGIFLFGGINETKTPTNLFFHMSIGLKPAVFDIPPTNGKPPSPRVSASMNFSTECNMIIIHGGKNDLHDQSFMNDITILDLETLDWIHPSCNNFIPPERAEHLSLIVGNQLIIFGGTSAEALMNFDFIMINLDF
jgi:hypothetical protein